MLFNSPEFIWLFLPVTFAVFFVLGSRSPRLAAAWLAAASIFFYGWWAASYVLLLAGSICVNFGFGRLIARAVERCDDEMRGRLLFIAILANLVLLGYYKYANFFVANVNAITGSGWSIGEIILPLGISFFTFTQIAFLVDTYKGLVKEYSFVHYCLFVTYFPHLIAGPVLHHKEMMPQFGRPETYRIDHAALALGLTIFLLGLFKKVILADGVAVYVPQVFDQAAATPGLIEAWGGALAYTCQLYFDFSGYSDMAVGLSLMFGVRLPMNFNSPYKAVNIVDFWRRWHMTLSRFLRDYLYIPLGGNRHGPVRRYANLLATMLLGGLWHGAGWTFVFWGALHGIYLMINYAWQAARVGLGHDLARSTFAGRLLGRAITFIAVVFAWVLFRADHVDTASHIMAGMVGLNGFTLRGLEAFIWPQEVLWIGLCLAIAFFAPNVYQLTAAFRPVLGKVQLDREPYELRFAWTPNGPWLTICIALGSVALLGVAKVSPFLYFQF